MKSAALIQTKHLPLIEIARSLVPPFIWQAMYNILVVGDIPDHERYGRFYRPWLEPKSRNAHSLVQHKTLVSAEGCWQLESRLRQSLNCEGEIYELGTYKGGTARLIREAMEGSGRTLRLFDTFSGMRTVDAANGDRHHAGDFADTSVEIVRAFVGDRPWVDYRVGWVPETFAGLGGDKIAFAHVDLDLYGPILAACEFIYPRLSAGASIVFDDYGSPSTVGARFAINEFFKDKDEEVIILQTGQAILTKL